MKAREIDFIKWDGNSSDLVSRIIFYGIKPIKTLSTLVFDPDPEEFTEDDQKILGRILHDRILELDERLAKLDKQNLD